MSHHPIPTSPRDLTVESGSTAPLRLLHHHNSLSEASHHNTITNHTRSPATFSPADLTQDPALAATIGIGGHTWVQPRNGLVVVIADGSHWGSSLNDWVPSNLTSVHTQSLRTHTGDIHTDGSHWGPSLGDLNTGKRFTAYEGPGTQSESGNTPSKAPTLRSRIQVIRPGSETRTHQPSHLLKETVYRLIGPRKRSQSQVYAI